MREAAADIAEGADIVMVKPAGPYLDVIRLVQATTSTCPSAGYQVSGEYSMIKRGRRQRLAGRREARFWSR